jgi:hypothetical protein
MRPKTLLPFQWCGFLNGPDFIFGIGYQLSDDTIGVLFKDLTQLLLHVDGKKPKCSENFFFIDYETLGA